MKTHIAMVVPFAAGLLLAGAEVAEASSQASGRTIVEEIVVRAHPLSAEKLAQPFSVLDGDALMRNLDSTLGGVVAHQPGVASTFYGQAVGRPVIHGLGGPRVRVLEDRIPSLDASIVSDDHAVTIEPFMADSIEILKGPSTLIYGSGAIGGVVDAHTGRIPHTLPDGPITGRIDGRFDDVAHQRTGAARFDGAAGPIAWHVDGFSRRLGDYDIPGYAESAALRRLEEDDHDEDDHDDDEEVRGTLPNSDLKSTGGAFGMSLVGDRGIVGFAVSRYESAYGLPGGAHGHHDDEHDEHDEHEAEEEGQVRLDLKQTRWDFEVELRDPFPYFTDLNVRLGVNDYQHKELEGPGEIGTTFEVEAWEGRIEAIHAPLGGWRGALGLQVGHEDFVAIGEEAFTPPTETDTLALFLLEERQFDRFAVQTGARLERTKVRAQDQGSERFNGVSASAGVVIPLAPVWELGVIADYAQRAPTAAELFSDGPHLATQSYELGDPDLDLERAVNLAATLRYRGDRLEGAATAYVTRFRDFIFQADTGEEEDGLPVRIWDQEDADFRGLDLEVRFKVLVDGPVALDSRVFYDFVDAKLDVSGNDHLPRLTPDRAGVGVETRWQWLTANVDYVRVMKQDQTADFELDTEAYNDLRAQVSGRFDLGGSELMLYVQGRNLTDDEQRNHVSFLKDFAPLPGRSVLAGMRLSF
jgi:iron complex outermembrane receptor protein